MSTQSRGVLVSVGSSLAFGLIYFLTPMLAPLSGEGVWAIRAMISVPFLALVLVALRSWRLAAEIGERIRRTPWLLVGVFTSGVLLAAQLWLFSWAPLNGRAMQVALGYFLLPLVLVVVGRVLYRDRMVWWQWVAAAVAAIGVAHEIWRIGGVSWETLLVALGYPAYFVLRRALGTHHLGGMWWELAVMFPFAVAGTVVEVVLHNPFAANPALWWAAPGISMFAALALVLYVLASRLLALSLFGLLSYLEPTLLVVAAVLIGERLAPGEWITYGAIWLAVLILVIGGVVSLVRAARAGREPPATTQPISLV